MERFGVALFAAEANARQRKLLRAAAAHTKRRLRTRGGGFLTSVGRVQRAFKRLAILPAVDVVLWLFVQR